PPPPPPAGPPSHQPTNDLGIRRSNEEEEGESEYEGDYDTDIASSAKHKDALKHTRDDSLDDTTADDSSIQQSPVMPHSLPPVPGAARAVPPPPPAHEPARRQSTDVRRPSMGSPRVAPPPVPAARMSAEMKADEYDPYRYSESQSAAAAAPRRATPGGGPPQLPQLPPMPPPEDEPELYPPPSRTSTDRRAPPPGPPPGAAPSAPHDRAAPPPPPPHMQPPQHKAPSTLPPMAGGSLPRRSMEVPEFSPPSRRSTDMARPPHDGGFIAHEIDLGRSTMWWTQPNMPPPALQNRRDILFEIEETGPDRNGAVAKTIYVLYQDYSQTVITARFDRGTAGNPVLEQKLEGPPGKLRQDQLEDAHTRFGARLAGLVSNAEGSVVGDGSPQALIIESVTQLKGALFPIGTRSYGALVYQNIGNATVQQFDEIRPGDVVSFRNAKFSGKHGSLHTKYSQEVGKPDHVAVVAEWDGTKKKVRGWEQGRDSEGGPDDEGPKTKGKSKGGKIKVKQQSFRLDDLRSGEVRVWRVMPRTWVGWDDTN
ncbi:MAG: hypothetical protein INR71_07020, partial [Terriglobus roseus]|nr:hypothetical protein [Terriglobus roseus]